MTPKFVIQIAIIAFLVAFSGKGLVHVGSEYRSWYDHEKATLFASQNSIASDDFHS